MDSMDGMGIETSCVPVVTFIRCTHWNFEQNWKEWQPLRAATQTIDAVYIPSLINLHIMILYICPYWKIWGKTAHGRSIFIFILYIYRHKYIYIYQIYLANSQTKTLSRCSWFRKTTTVFNPNRAAWRTGPREYHGKGMWRPNACGVAAVHDAGFPPKMVHFVDDEKEGFEHVWMVFLDNLKGRIEVSQPSPQLRICEILINQCMNSQINLPLCR